MVFVFPILLFLIIVFLKKEKNIGFIKKYWFYEKSRTKKLAFNFYIIALILFFISLLDVRIGEQKYKNKESERTIILIDNSLSMRAKDLKPSRINRALEFAGLFLNLEKGVPFL